MGAPISVSSKSGKNRIIFDLVIPADPRISNGKVEWLEGGVLKDAEFKISRTTTKIDTVEIDITEIAGGIFSFDFFLQDTKGNKSAKLSKTATVYDDEYGSLLIPRRISKLKSYATNNPEIDSVLLIWATPLKQVVNSTLKYTDNNSVLRTLAIDNSVVLQF